MHIIYSDIICSPSFLLHDGTRYDKNILYSRYTYTSIIISTSSFSYYYNVRPIARPTRPLYEINFVIIIRIMQCIWYLYVSVRKNRVARHVSHRPLQQQRIGAGVLHLHTAIIGHYVIAIVYIYTYLAHRVLGITLLQIIF